MAQNQLRILAIDDDADFLNIVERMLTRQGYEVIKAMSGAEGLRIAYSAHPHAILLDIMMPSYDGFEVCRRLREMTDTCIIFITAKGRTEDIVRGLSLGADDYITKPFRMEELVSRLSACLRRTSGVQASRVPVPLSDGDNLILDKSRRQVVVRGDSVRLTAKEFELLEYLIQHAGRVLTKEAILAHIWGSQYIGDADLLKQFIYRLRRKLEEDPREPRYIQTVRGVGYCFETGN